MFLKNTDKREHATFNCGYTYIVPKGKTVNIPDRIAVKMMRRWPKLVPVDSKDEAAALEGELEMAENNMEMECAEDDELESELTDEAPDATA